MLPQSYELPAAVLLVLGGALACFAGYRLFRSCSAIYGFILGAMFASSMMGVGEHDRHDRRGDRRRSRRARDSRARVLRRRRAGRRRRSARSSPRRLGQVGAGDPPSTVRRSCSAVVGAIGAMFAAALRDHRRHGVRRRVDDDRRRLGGIAADRGAARRRQRATCGSCIRSRRRRASAGCRWPGSRLA